MSQAVDKPTLPGIQFLLSSSDEREEKKMSTSQEGGGSMNTRPMGHRSTRSVSSLPSDLQKLSLYPSTTHDDNITVKQQQQRQDTLMMESNNNNPSITTTTTTTANSENQQGQGGGHLPFTMSSPQNSSNSKAPSWMYQSSGPVLLPPLPHQLGSSNSASTTPRHLSNHRSHRHHQHHRRPAGATHGRSVSEYTIPPQHQQHHLQPPVPPLPPTSNNNTNNNNNNNNGLLQTPPPHSQLQHQRPLLPFDSLPYMNRPTPPLSTSPRLGAGALNGVSGHGGGRHPHHTHRRAVSANTVDFMFRPPVPSTSSSSSSSSTTSSHQQQHPQQQHQHHRAQSDSPPEQRLRSPPLLPTSSSTSSSTLQQQQEAADDLQSQQPQLQRDANSGRYLCPYCNKGFSRPSSLRIHTYSHTGEKPFICAEEGCGRRFSVQSNMRRHLRVHRMGRSSVKTGSPLRKL